MCSITASGLNACPLQAHMKSKNMNRLSIRLFVFLMWTKTTSSSTHLHSTMHISWHKLYLAISLNHHHSSLTVYSTTKPLHKACKRLPWKSESLTKPSTNLQRPCTLLEVHPRPTTSDIVRIAHKIL